MSKQPKSYPEIAREVLEKNDFEPMNIKIAPKHLERIRGVAEIMELTVPEAATFLLYSYINDMELVARQQEIQKLNKN